MKKLIPAFALLLVSAVLMSTASFAWFSMNNTVTVTGMEIRTKVSSNLLISETNASAASYGNSLTQTRIGLLEPSSTVNGINYYWTSTSNVDARGDAIAETYYAYNEDTAWGSAHTDAGKTSYDDDFNNNYGFTTPTAGADTVAYGYIDYVFYLKGVNTEASAKDIKLTNLEFKYNGGPVSANDKAWRIALISQDATEYTPLATAATAANVVSIFTLPGATNFDTAPKAIGSTGLEALDYGSSVAAYNQAGIVAASVASGATVYKKVTVRLWLEGEDTSCTNATYALLTNAYTLNLTFEFATATDAVTNIARYGTVKVGATKDGSDSGTATTTVDGTASTKTLYAYTTTSGFTVYSEDATITAASIFYSLDGTAATTIGAQTALK